MIAQTPLWLPFHDLLSTIDLTVKSEHTAPRNQSGRRDSTVHGSTSPLRRRVFLHSSRSPPCKHWILIAPRSWDMPRWVRGDVFTDSIIRRRYRSEQQGRRFPSTLQTKPVPFYDGISDGRRSVSPGRLLSPGPCPFCAPLAIFLSVLFLAKTCRFFTSQETQHREQEEGSGGRVTLEPRLQGKKDEHPFLLCLLSETGRGLPEWIEVRRSMGESRVLLVQDRGEIEWTQTNIGK